jgi:hypothetical protein
MHNLYKITDALFIQEAGPAPSQQDRNTGFNLFSFSLPLPDRLAASIISWVCNVNQFIISSPPRILPLAVDVKSYLNTFTPFTIDMIC